MNGVHHRSAILAFAAWPLAFWRFDALDERDFEWFEAKYPGWYAQYGSFWEAFRRSSDPSSPFLPLELINLAPPFCWTCQGLCVCEADRRHRVVTDSAGTPRTRFYCSRECAWMDESNPGRYTGDRNFLDRYHGWEASEVVRDLGFVRADGKTLVGQPHLRAERRWTLADLRRYDLEFISPNIRTAAELGLPSGDWSAAAGQVPYGVAT